jgi:signal peptidase I
MPPDATAHSDPQRLRMLPEPATRAAHGSISVARLLSSALLCGVVLLIVVAVLGMVLGVWRFAVIDTGSMHPNLNPGDVAVLTSEPTVDLRRGQVVAFHPPGEPRLTVVHRVFSIHRIRNGVIIQTKGDANNTTDPWRARIIGKTVWRESLKAPKLGYLSVFAQQRPARLGLLIAIVVLAVSALMGAIWRPRSAEEPGRASAHDGPWTPAGAG